MVNNKSRYLNVGCGLSVGESWLNFDASPTLRASKIPLLSQLLKIVKAPDWPKEIKYGDIVKGLPVESDSCKIIFCSHAMEHLSLADFNQALSNIYKYLEPHGVFRVIMPDLETYVRRYADAVSQNNGKNEAAVRFMKETQLGCETSRMGIFRRVKEALANSRHQWLWDRGSLTEVLKSHGFKNIKVCRYREWSSPLFAEVENEQRHADAICLEAVK